LIQVELWHLILAALVPTIAVVFSAGMRNQKLVELELKVKKVEQVPEILAEIKTDLEWIKRAIEDGRDRFSSR
jgi:hypothetical protein